MNINMFADNDDITTILVSNLPPGSFITMSLVSKLLRSVTKTTMMCVLISKRYLAYECNNLYSLILCYNSQNIGDQWRLFYDNNQIELLNCVLNDNYDEACRLGYTKVSDMNSSNSKCLLSILHPSICSAINDYLVNTNVPPTIGWMLAYFSHFPDVTAGVALLHKFCEHNPNYFIDNNVEVNDLLQIIGILGSSSLCSFRKRKGLLELWYVVESFYPNYCVNTIDYEHKSQWCVSKFVPKENCESDPDELKTKLFFLAMVECDFQLLERISSFINNRNIGILPSSDSIYESPELINWLDEKYGERKGYERYLPYSLYDDIADLIFDGHYDMAERMIKNEFLRSFNIDITRGVSISLATNEPKNFHRGYVHSSRDNDICYSTACGTSARVNPLLSMCFQPEVEKSNKHESNPTSLDTWHKIFRAISSRAKIGPIKWFIEYLPINYENNYSDLLEFLTNKCNKSSVDELTLNYYLEWLSEKITLEDYEIISLISCIATLIYWLLISTY